MLIQQIIKLELREPGPSGRTCTPITGNFLTKRKSRSGLLFTAKIMQEAMWLTFLYLGQIAYKM